MIKKTLSFSNPAVLSLANGQLVIKLTQSGNSTTIPIEDIGVVVLDHPQITITHMAIAALLENNAALITCNSKHMPTGLSLPLDGNTLQSERFRDQIDASQPLKKQLWQQTVAQKIRNQAAILQSVKDCEVGNMLAWAQKVRSGDADNLEGRAAVYYWSQLMDNFPQWSRDPDGLWPNAIFNYGYAILRAIVARALVSSGLLPTLGIFHRNRYNAYCLADDIMEPYRPIVDQYVLQILPQFPQEVELNSDIKKHLLQIPVLDVVIGGKRSPLMVGVSQTTASLYKCYSGELRKIIYPELELT